MLTVTCLKCLVNIYLQCEDLVAEASGPGESNGTSTVSYWSTVSRELIFLMCRAIEKQGGYRTARTRNKRARNKRATLTVLSSSISRRRRVHSRTREHQAQPATAPPPTGRRVSPRGMQPAAALSIHPSYEDEASRRHHSSPNRLFSAHANQAAHVNRDITRGRPPHRPSRLRRNPPPEEDGKSARFRIVKIVQISTFLYS